MARKQLGAAIAAAKDAVTKAYADSQPGIVGATGPVGATGATGATGTSGPPGATGSIGRSIATITADTTLGAAPHTDYIAFTATANVKQPSALLHMDGSNGSTTVVDSSTLASNWTASGSAQISTAQSKFGGASLLMSGGTVTATANLTNFTFGTGDFTIEFWCRWSSLDGSRVVYDQRTHFAEMNAPQPCLYTSWSVLRYFVNGADRITSGTLTVNTWYHIALTRSGTSTKLFINGVQAGSTWTDTTDYTTTAPKIASEFTGYINELRIFKGYARYTSGFTPPASAFAGNGEYAVPVVVTLPAAAGNSNIYSVKDIYSVKNVDGYGCTIGCVSGTIDGASTVSVSTGGGRMLVSDGTMYRSLVTV